MLLEIRHEPARFLAPYKTGASTRTTGRGIGRWEANPNRTKRDLSSSPSYSGRFLQCQTDRHSGTPAWGNLTE